MKILAAAITMTFLAFFPMAASAQGFGGSLNVNLNDAMMMQRNQQMSALLNDPNTASLFAHKKHHQKRDKKNKDAMVAKKIGDDTSSNGTVLKGSIETDSVQLSHNVDLPAGN